MHDQLPNAYYLEKKNNLIILNLNNCKVFLIFLYVFIFFISCFTCV